jgi:hypothetical protein
MGFGTSNPAQQLDVSGVTRTNGLITGGYSSGVYGNITSYCKQYSYFKQTNSTNTINIIFNFTNVSNYARIVSMILEPSNANNLSTLILEVTGGHMFGGTPSNSMKVITSNQNGNGTYTWSSNVTTGLSNVNIQTNTSSANGYYFNFFVETFGGSLSNIVVDGITSITYNY